MKKYIKWISAWLLCAMILGEIAECPKESESTVFAAGQQEDVPKGSSDSEHGDSAARETVNPPTQTPSGGSVIPGTVILPSTSPAVSPCVTPTVTPIATPKSEALILENKGAKYSTGGQKGIGYGKVKKVKIYHINAYVTDPIKLQPSRPSTYKVVGGISKKEAKKIKVSTTGVVTCKDKTKDKKQYAIVSITAKDTKETIYVYLYFAPALYAKSAKKQVVYQGKTAKLLMNYGWKKVTFQSSKTKVARVDKKGKITARKKGKTTIIVKVKGSDKNQVKLTVRVKEEPWLVNDKDTVYSYEDMTKDLREIAWKYRGKVSLQNLGSSEDGRNIWCLRMGNASARNKVLINAGIHAREWLNPQMIVRKCEEILREYPDYKQALGRTCVYVVPMINPDGIAISQYGFGVIRSPKLRKICQKTKASYRTWKGNARGVNLNFNFPAGWNPKDKKKKPDGITYPGKKAASEKETRVMMSLVNRMSGLKGALNYHSTGSILYWNYNVESNASLYSRQRALAYKVNSYTKYRLMPKSISTDPNGGFGDWLIYTKKIPNVTVETGSVMCPLPFSQMKKITRENTGVLSWFVKNYIG
nr:Ig-like domain-containing protein [Eubacterium sp.]